MIRICCRCKKVMGEKAPFEDKTETHGYCDPCLAIVLEEMKKLRETWGKDGHGDWETRRHGEIEKR